MTIELVSVCVECICYSHKKRRVQLCISNWISVCQPYIENSTTCFTHAKTSFLFFLSVNSPVTLLSLSLPSPSGQLPATGVGNDTICPGAVQRLSSGGHIPCHVRTLPVEPASQDNPQGLPETR